MKLKPSTTVLLLLGASNAMTSPKSWVTCTDCSDSEQLKLVDQVNSLYWDTHAQLKSDKARLTSGVEKDIFEMVKQMHPEAITSELTNFSQCVLNAHGLGSDAMDLNDIGCHGFELDFNKIDSAKQQKVMKNWNSTQQDTAFAFNQMSKDIFNDVKSVQLKHKKNVNILANKFASESSKLFIAAGCSGSIVSKCTSAVEQFVQNGCPDCECSLTVDKNAMSFNQWADLQQDIEQPKTMSVTQAISQKTAEIKQLMSDHIAETFKSKMPVIPIADISTVLMSDHMHQKILIKDQHKHKTLDVDSLPTINDLIVVLVPLLAVFAGIGVGINFAMIQEEANIQKMRLEKQTEEEDSFKPSNEEIAYAKKCENSAIKIEKKSTRQLIEDEFEFEYMSE